MFLQSAAQPNLFDRFDFFQLHKLFVQHIHCLCAQNVCEATRHAGAKIQSQRAEH
jgi:hypothetical protein